MYEVRCEDLQIAEWRLQIRGGPLYGVFFLCRGLVFGEKVFGSFYKVS